MAKKTQSYDVVFNLIAKGGDQAKTRMTEIVKLAQKLGKNDLADEITGELKAIEDTYSDIITRVFSPERAKTSLTKTYASIRKILESTDIFGAEQAEEATKKIQALKTEIDTLETQIKKTETISPASLFKQENAKFKVKRRELGIADIQKGLEDAFTGKHKNSDLENVKKATELISNDKNFSNFNALNNLFNSISTNTANFTQEQQKAIEDLELFIKAVNKASREEQKINTIKEEQIKAKRDEEKSLEDSLDWYEKNKETIEELIKVTEEYKEHITQSGYANEDATDKSQKNADAIRDQQQSNDELNNTVKGLIDRYISLGIVYSTLKNIIREFYQTTKELDDAFAEIAVVSEYTTKEVWSMYDAFLNIANATGTTSEQIIKVVGEYFKQGKSLSESLKLTEAAAISANVAGIDAMESVRYLTSALNGYQLSANDALSVSDKFSKLAAVSATDYADLAIALGKVAAQANASGVEMDSLLGYMTTALEVTQEAPENIGTAFKTIFARMSEIKNYGKVLEDNTSANQVSKALASIGIQLFDTTGQMRDLDDVIYDVGSKWSSLDTVQQKYIATAMAGTRQQTRLISIFQDWDTTMSYVEASMNSNGATIAQYTKKSETITFALNKLTNAWQNFNASLSSSGVIVTILNALTDLVNLASNFSQILVLAGAAFGTIIGVSTIDKVFRLSEVFGELNKSIATGTLNILKFFGITVHGEKKLLKEITLKKLWTKITKKQINVQERLNLSLAKTPKLLIAVAIVALIVLINDLAKRTDKLKKKVADLYTEIYNRNETQNSVEKLIEQFDKLDAKIIKTTQDFEELQSIKEQLIEKTGKEDLFTLSGSLDKKVYEDWKKEQIQAQIDSTQKAYNTLMQLGGLGNSYYSNNSTAAQKAMALNILTMQELTKEYDNANEAIEKYYNNLGIYSQEEIKAAEKRAKAKALLETTTANTRTKVVEIKDQYGKVLSSQEAVVASTLGEDLYDALGSATTNIDINDFIEEIENKLSGKELSENSPLNDLFAIKKETMQKNLGESFDLYLQLLSSMGDEYSAAATLWNAGISDTFEASLKKVQDLTDYVAKALKNPAIGEAVLGTSDIVNKITDLLTYSTKQNSDEIDEYFQNMTDAYKTMSNGFKNETEDWTSELMTKYKAAGIEAKNLGIVFDQMYKQMADLDWESIANSITSSTTALDEANKLLADGDIVNGIAKIEEIMALYPQYAEEISNSIIENGQISEEVSAQIKQNAVDELKAKLEADAEYNKVQAEGYAALAKLYTEKAKDDAFITQKGYENRVNALDGELIANKEFAEKTVEIYKRVQAAKEKIYSGEQIDNIYLDDISDLLVVNYEKENQQYWQQLAQQAAEKSTQYYQQYLAKQGILKAIDQNLINILGKNQSTATENAKEYEKQLTRLYTILQKIEGLDAKKALLNSMNSYYEAIDDGASQRAINKETQKILEQQIKLYQEKADVIREEQNIIGRELSKEAKAMLSIDEETGRLILDYDKYAKASQKVQEEVDNFTGSWEDLQGQLEETQSIYFDLMTEIEELNQKVIDSTIDYQNKIKEAYIKYYQDIYQQQINALEKEQELLDKRKEMYQDAFDDEDYQNELGDIDKKRANLIEQLAALEGASDSKSKVKKAELLEELEELNKEYNDKVKDYNRDSLLEQVDNQKDAIDEQKDKLQELMDQVPYQVELLEQAINELTQQGSDAVVEFLQKWSDDWRTALSTERQEIEEDWKELYEYLYGDDAVSAYMEYYNGLLAKAKETYNKINQYASGSGNGNGGNNKSSGSSTSNGNYNSQKYYLGSTELGKYLSQYSAIEAAVEMLKRDLGIATVSKDMIKEYVNTNPSKPIYAVADDDFNELVDIKDTPPKHHYRGKVRKYKNGGYVNYTGPAWVDGSPGSPEAFLNSSQTRMFENLTLAIQKMYNNNGYQGFNGNVSIENITIKTDELNSSQDFAKAGNALASSLQEALRQRGIITNLKR